jgi:hypothetical protein
MSRSYTSLPPVHAWCVAGLLCFTLLFPLILLQLESVFHISSYEWDLLTLHNSQGIIYIEREMHTMSFFAVCRCVLGVYD